MDLERDERDVAADLCEENGFPAAAEALRLPAADPQCDACHFWRRRPTSGEPDSKGACHRYPPAPDGHYHDYPVWTNTWFNDWCGEYRRKQDT